MATMREQASELRRSDGRQIRVLVVDDESALSELLAMALPYEGWEVRTAGDGGSAVRAAREFRPDAVVLDMRLPDFDGFEVLRRMRAEDPDVLVLFLTARDAAEDRVAGLAAGADDYVTKPFRLEELVARLRRLLRRTRMTAPRQSSELVVGDLVVDEDSQEVRRGDDLIELTATEFELLRYLMRYPGRVLSKALILDRVWNYDFGGQSNVVELYVSYLRKKIDAGRAPMIRTVRAVGYVLEPPAAGAEPRTAAPAEPSSPRV
jgi:two-component system OmpR family response regulator